MNKTKLIVEQIHAEFDTAVELLLQKTLNIAHTDQKIQSTLGTLQKRQRLDQLGFNAVALNETELKTNRSLQELLSFKKNLQTVVEYYRMEFPLYKFILYPQVLEICAKYQLYLGNGSLYQGTVPDSNLEQIESFNTTAMVKLQQAGKTRRINTHGFAYEEDYYNGHLGYHICAPGADFKAEGTIRIGHEILRTSLEKPSHKDRLETVKIPDPVVLCPVKCNGIGTQGFLIVTAWGPEASDPLVVNNLLN